MRTTLSPRDGRACARRRLAALAHLAALAVLVSLPAWLPSTAHAAQPPIVYHSTLPDHANPGVHTLASGVQTLELYLEIGSVATQTPGQQVCFDGTGDEICGFTLVLEATGGASIVDFCPNGQCSSGLIHHLDPAAGLLRINRLGPAIDQVLAPFWVGRLTVQATSEAGELRMHVDSQAVSAAVQMLGVRDNDPIAVTLPEPGGMLGLGVGLAGLAQAARWSRRTRASRSGAARTARGGAAVAALRASIAACAFLASAPFAATAQLYTDAAAFSAAVVALGSPPERLGFETVPLSPAGFAGLSQDVRLGPVRLRSRSLAADVDLAFLGGVPLGVFGTLLVADPAASGNPSLHPGGTAMGSGVRGDDDVRIVFDVPMLAAGLRVLENVTEAGESIEFLDAQGQVVASLALPGSASPPGANGFVGYVLQPGDAPIKAIQIEESATDADDIALDEILFESSADSYADFVAAFAPTIAGGEPIAPNLVSDESVGAPDSQTVSLGVGGQLVVQFTDNTLSGSDDALPDLRIFEADAELEGSAVFVSANGVDWTAVGTIGGGTQTIDLDAFGFDARDTLSFVQIVDDASQGSASGPAVGADLDAVEALSGTWRPQDGDGDHVPDDYDVCPNRYDEAQSDDDVDGVGNVCDNCRALFNPGQQDTDLDGQGDACEPAGIRLVRDFAPVALDGKARLAELRLDCGGSDVYSLIVGLWRPPGPASFDFGGNCDAPQPAFAPPGAPHGVGCTGPGIILGATVEPAKSGAFGVPLGDPMPGFRPDVVFVTLRGADSNGGKLCSAFQSNVFLGRLRGGVPLNLSQDAVASFSLEDVFENGWCPVGTIGGTCAERSNLAYFLESPLPPVAEIRIQPAALEGSGTAVEWDVCIADTTVAPMHRITVGFLGPVDADYPTLLLDDCLDGPDASGKRSCLGEVGTDPEWVDESVTFTHGPLDAASGDLLPSTLYTPIEGGAPGTGGIDVLNRVPFRDYCVGIVTNEAPPATLGAPPILVRDGFFELAYHDAGGAGGPQPYQTADQVLEALDGASVYETIVFNAGDDLDGDGFVDSVDNCPFTANADQSDDGGFGSDVPNGHGNACECGDANGSGKVVSAPETGAGGVPLVPDLQLLREYLVGLHPGDATIESLCSVDGDTACNTADVVVLERALAGLESDPNPRCAAAVD